MKAPVGSRQRTTPKGGYDPRRYQWLATIADRHFWFRARNRVIAALGARLIARLPSGFRVLEIGCGTGNVLRVLERLCGWGVVVGLDLYNEGLHFARRHTHCLLVQGDARALPFGCEFDVVCAFDVLEHFNDDADVLSKISALLKPRGALLLTVSAHMSLWSYFDDATGHCRRYSRSLLAARLADSGYSVEFLSEYMASILPLIWFGRRVVGVARRRFRERISPAELTHRDFRIIPGLNDLLALLLSLEAVWLARKHRLPFGASLLAVARKL